jgi:hypothetical protein
MGHANKADKLLIGQRAAAGLSAGEGLQRVVDRRRLTVEPIEHPHAELDGLVSCRRQLDTRKLLPSASGARLQARRDALVEELRLGGVAMSGS